MTLNWSCAKPDRLKYKPNITLQCPLTLWGRVTHVCTGLVASFIFHVFLLNSFILTFVLYFPLFPKEMLKSYISPLFFVAEPTRMSSRFGDVFAYHIILVRFIWIICPYSLGFLNWNWDTIAPVYAGIILYMCPANERRRYNVTPSLIGWVHTQDYLSYGEVTLKDIGKLKKV